MKRRKGDRFGTLVFLIPILLVVALVAFAVIETASFKNGTLIVKAQTSTRYSPSVNLNASVSVAGKSGVTPFTLSLPQGTYTVSFPTQPWVMSPPSRNVNVTSGGTAYVVGVYTPIPVSVSVAQGKFNRTSADVLHKVTPLVWVNPSSEDETITSSLTGQIVIPPMQNYTYVFRSQGTFAFSFVGIPSPELTVTSI